LKPSHHSDPGGIFFSRHLSIVSPRSTSSSPTVFSSPLAPSRVNMSFLLLVLHMSGFFSPTTSRESRVSLLLLLHVRAADNVVVHLGLGTQPRVLGKRTPTAGTPIPPLEWSNISRKAWSAKLETENFNMERKLLCKFLQ
jgi:hypothetical protein